DLDPSEPDRGHQPGVHALQGRRRGCSRPHRGLRRARAQGRGRLHVEGADDGPAPPHPREEDRRARAPGRGHLTAAAVSRRACFWLAALLLASAVVSALPLGRRPLGNQDEARYSLLARQAVEQGRWVLPRVRDEVYLNKPPLYFWTVALLALPFGAVTDATAPLASVLSAVMGLLAIFLVGRRLWGEHTGLAAAVVLATSPFYFFMAHQVFTDMMLTAWMTWALYFYLVSLDGQGRGALAAFYLCAAGGFAAKGPAALMVL